jgi:hypothetical protein
VRRKPLAEGASVVSTVLLFAHCFTSGSFHQRSRQWVGIEWRSRWQFQLPAAIANGIVKRMENGDTHGGCTAV